MTLAAEQSAWLTRAAALPADDGSVEWVIWQHEAMRDNPRLRPGTISAEGYVLRHGRHYHNQPFPSEYADFRWREDKECFRNATLMSGQYPELTYVEGFGRRELPLPIHHAWCVDPNGNVVDPTWDYQEGTDYLGVEFPDVAKMVMRAGRYTILDWTDVHGLLRTE